MTTQENLANVGVNVQISWTSIVMLVIALLIVFAGFFAFKKYIV